MVYLNSHGQENTQTLQGNNQPEFHICFNSFSCRLEKQIANKTEIKLSSVARWSKKCTMIVMKFLTVCLKLHTFYIIYLFETTGTNIRILHCWYEFANILTTIVLNCIHNGVIDQPRSMFSVQKFILVFTMSTNINKPALISAVHFEQDKRVRLANWPIFQLA